LYSAKVHYTHCFEKIASDLYLTGAIPRCSFEDSGGRFFHDPNCKIADCVPEEQALLTTDGVLISGCCHAGLINTMEYCSLRKPNIKIHTIVGGLHLRNASAERLQKTADHLRNAQVKKLYIMHCTGSNAIAELQKLLPETLVCSPKLGESWEC
jgi:7,8-dihydropterin-6-yl-methyl-4-(beta-D-ribofuranosyl)aminobenzene 5'-phosphate synthase